MDGLCPARVSEALWASGHSQVETARLCYEQREKQRGGVQGWPRPNLQGQSQDQGLPTADLGDLGQCHALLGQGESLWLPRRWTLSDPQVAQSCISSRFRIWAGLWPVAFSSHQKDACSPGHRPIQHRHSLSQIQPRGLSTQLHNQERRDWVPSQRRGREAQRRPHQAMFIGRKR